VTNLIAAAVFTASMTHLMSFWLAHMRTHSAAFAFAQPWFAVSVAGAVASLLYFIAFCGVAFIHSDVEQMTLGTGNIGAAPIIGSVQARDVDADVVIVGCGTAGASLATQLARQGKRVTVIERCVAGGGGCWAAADVAHVSRAVVAQRVGVGRVLLCTLTPPIFPSALRPHACLQHLCAGREDHRRADAAGRRAVPGAHGAERGG
jgi:hypothetical protein